MDVTDTNVGKKGDSLMSKSCVECIHLPMCEYFISLGDCAEVCPYYSAEMEMEDEDELYT